MNYNRKITGTFSSLIEAGGETTLSKEIMN